MELTDHKLIDVKGRVRWVPNGFVGLDFICSECGSSFPYDEGYYWTYDFWLKSNDDLRGQKRLVCKPCYNSLKDKLDVLRGKK